ncbi:NYN domain-containing protein [Candidatus Microgenomates bacterium]|nr:NYN domain-containing protein [Candidatus Microgenomates bacterium]
MSKTYLFIDGTNLYAGQYELVGPHRYVDFSSFIGEIEKKIRTAFDKIYFYASYSPKSKHPTHKEKLYLKNEALFYRSVKNTKRTIFFTGYRSKTSGKEKEVDVKLAVDIVDFAHRNYYDRMYFISGDADFMHGLNLAKKLKKKVYVLALENRIPIRFTYNFKTYIFVSKNSKLHSRRFEHQQKIAIVPFNIESFVRSIA